MSEILANVTFNKSRYNIHFCDFDKVSTVLDILGNFFPFPREFSTLIFKGKKLSENSTVKEAGITNGSNLLLTCSTEEEVKRIRSGRSDPLVKGFGKELADEHARRLKTEQLALESPWSSSKQDKEFKFCRYLSNLTLYFFVYCKITNKKLVAKFHM